LAADGKDDEALQYLEEARGLIRGSILEQSLRDHDLIEASLALRRGDRGRCHALLTNAFDAARYGGTASFAFSFYPAFMAQLCAEALRAGMQTRYVSSLIRQYGLVPEAPDIEAWPWPIKIHTLGRFVVLKDDIEIRFARKTQRRPLDLLQALIALGGREVAVSALTEALWPDAEGDAAYHAFENTLYRLRQLLGSASSLALASGKLSLDPRRCWVDVWALERRLDNARESGTISEQCLDNVMQLYRGHFLDHEPPQSWILPVRERLRDKFLRYVESVARSYEGAQQWERAAAVYQRGIELDQLAESLYRGLMICYREQGNHSEALKVYRRCRDMLSVVLGVQPTAETQAVYQSLKQT
jgi:DNA-binding SARP family transcriptional activator